MYFHALLLLLVGDTHPFTVGPPPASSQDVMPPTPDPTADAAQSASVLPWYESITVNGFLSLYAETNFNRPRSGMNRFRVFDAPADSFEIPVAELVVQRTATKPSQSGFRVDLTTGSTVPRAAAARGFFRDPLSGAAEDFDVQQAYVSWIAPIGNGLRFDAGKHVTHMGTELIEGYDGWNDNATRSFLFGFAIPFTHTGIRASYAFTDRFSAQLFVVNGWDSVRDNNSAKSLGAQLACVPANDVSLALNLLTGPEQTGDDGDTRHVVDVVWSWKLTTKLTLGLNFDYGTEERATASGDDAIWSGIAGYARYQITPRFSVALRGEDFDDRDGARTGFDQDLHEITLTPELRLDDNLRIRLDLRRDWSDRAVFETDDGRSRRQTTALVNVIWSF